MVACPVISRMCSCGNSGIRFEVGWGRADHNWQVPKDTV